MTASLEALQANVETARAALAANRCPETMKAFQDAWNALSAASHNPKHGMPRTSRAGRRQAAELRALHGRGR